MEKLPTHLQSAGHPFFAFNKAIIDATHTLVCTYKPNSAFYEARGEQGIHELKMTFDYIRETYPEIPILLDFKRGDIGNTNKGYAAFAFDYLQVDAITLQPYQGIQALQPFLEYAEKGIFILCKTSNEGSNEFQNLVIVSEAKQSHPFYLYLAQKVVLDWNTNNNCFLVVGATYPEELAEVRKIAGDMTFLVPGIGAQGGEVEATIKAGLNSRKAGMIVNSSRGVIFSGSNEDFAEKAQEEATRLRDTINKYR